MSVYPQRKEIERKVFDHLYLVSTDNVDEATRLYYLSDSDEFFINRIKELVPGKNVLEIGCGAAKHSIAAALAGAETINAVDISKEGINLAEKQAIKAGIRQKINFQVMDIEALKFEDNTFDVIINHEVFSSIDLSIVMRELKRVLKKGGVILGKETFGHNPIFNLKRSLNVLLRKRTAWAASHIFKSKDIQQARKEFSKVSVSYFHLTIPLAFPLKYIAKANHQKRIAGILSNLDRRFLSFKFIQNMAFKVVFEFTK